MLLATWPQSRSACGGQASGPHSLARRLGPRPLQRAAEPPIWPTPRNEAGSSWHDAARTGPQARVALGTRTGLATFALTLANENK